MQKLPRLLCCVLAFALIGGSVSAADVKLKLSELCNLFAVDAPVKLALELDGFSEGTGEAVVMTTNFFNETARHTIPVTIVAGEESAHTLELPAMEPGYYDVDITLNVTGSNGVKVAGKSERASIGVVTFVERTAKEAREQNSRFGLKIFQIGKPGVWWRKGVVWDLDKVVGATAKLGLHWTRHNISQGDPEQPGTISTLDLVQKHPMNVIIKIEGMPDEAYDAKRYGPLEDFKKNHPRKAKHNHRRTTVPLKEPYQKWLKEQINTLPADQNVFEIGNEVWNYMSGEEFAEWCKMVVEAVNEIRPNAVIGMDPGEISRPEFSGSFIKAGGLEGINAIYVHPYTFAPEPETRTRMELRNHRDYLQMRAGRELDYYVTEYGWPSVPPKYAHKVSQSVSEERQAQRTVRQSLMLYAEDMKTLIPHMMGDREEKPDDWDDWFGMFSLNGQPRPVIVAHAVSAKMFDSSRYVGEFRYGPRIGAMLFERDGVFTLALWAGEEKNRKVDIEVGVPELTHVDIMGREKKVSTKDGRLSLELTPSTVYLVGVSPDLEKNALPPDSELDPDQWWTRIGGNTSPRMESAPEIDGVLQEWKGIKPLIAKDSVKAWTSWDNDHVYFSAEVKDNEVVAQKELAKSDAIMLELSTKPGRQLDMPSKNLYDYRFLFAPQTSDKPARFEVRNQLWIEPQAGEAGRDHESGIRYASKKTENGWTVEVAIPAKYMMGFPEKAENARLSASVVHYDVARKGKPKTVQLTGEAKPAAWPYLTLTP